MSKGLGRLVRTPLCVSFASVAEVSSLYRGYRRLMGSRNIGLVTVSCVRLLCYGVECASGDECLRLGCFAEELGSLTGRLRVPVVILSRLGHGLRSHRNCRNGQPRLVSLQSDNALYSSSSVIIFVRHPSCFGVFRSSRKGSLHKVTRVVVTGRHGNTLTDLLLEFGKRCGRFSGPSSSVGGRGHGRRGSDFGSGVRSCSGPFKDGGPLPFWGFTSGPLGAWCVEGGG